MTAVGRNDGNEYTMRHEGEREDKREGQDSNEDESHNVLQLPLEIHTQNSQTADPSCRMGHSQPSGSPEGLFVGGSRK